MPSTIHSQPIHKALAFMLDHMPPCMHLVLITRSDPPRALARLRVRKELLELRAADLRFTGAEASLGKQFSVQVTIQEGHELVTQGPFRYLRHPLLVHNAIQLTISFFKSILEKELTFWSV